ncbi:gluconate transporter inducer Gti1 [Schizosaccharomyces japonicus yFS275]|uniref:Gluconate transporter inducer Gti1 n=1 Tax=Schizosaccharomyces japonicus (strain yFS275 / FY16936) TaxID=402676 RepID=B6K844_SCHJY|nr:gluconate transporter inducer Gti1 [Schizosaccharomyces japonicus yFS275]EEB09698.1 gluconate transporter inducer Gti1 [Schizosaccharomyces japonicus yFS275]
MEPTFIGYIASTFDALLLFEACYQSKLSLIKRRLTSHERKTLIHSGSIFIYDEGCSNVKRWTDGLTWSPSRIVGNFLLYKELDNTISKKRDNKDIYRKRVSYPVGSKRTQGHIGNHSLNNETQSSRLKADGLVKKTITISLFGRPHHLISYYSVNDVAIGKLRSPSELPQFQDIKVSTELLQGSNFRISPIVEKEKKQFYESISTSIQEQQTMLDNEQSGLTLNTMKPADNKTQATPFQENDPDPVNYLSIDAHTNCPTETPNLLDMIIFKNLKPPVMEELESNLVDYPLNFEPTASSMVVNDADQLLPKTFPNYEDNSSFNCLDHENFNHTVSFYPTLYAGASSSSPPDKVKASISNELQKYDFGTGFYVSDSTPCSNDPVLLNDLCMYPPPNPHRDIDINPPFSTLACKRFKYYCDNYKTSSYHRTGYPRLTRL